MTNVRPEIVRTIGEGQITTSLANTLSNDPFINMEARITSRVNETRRIRLESEKFRSTLHSYKETENVYKIFHFLRNLFSSLANFLLSIRKTP